MVIASTRWFGVRMDVITSLLIATVALAAVLASQEAGKDVMLAQCFVL